MDPISWALLMLSYGSAIATGAAAIKLYQYMKSPMEFNDDNLMGFYLTESFQKFLQTHGGGDANKSVNIAIHRKYSQSVDDLVRSYVGIYGGEAPSIVKETLENAAKKARITLGGTISQFRSLKKDQYMADIDALIALAEGLAGGLTLDVVRGVLNGMKTAGYESVQANGRAGEFNFGVFAKNGDTFKFLVFSFLFNEDKKMHKVELVAKAWKSKEKLNSSHVFATFSVRDYQFRQFVLDNYKIYFSDEDPQLMHEGAHDYCLQHLRQYKEKGITPEELFELLSFNC